MSAVLQMFLISLGLTILIELPLSLLFSREKKSLLVVLLVNILTNPPAVLICFLTSVFLSAKLYYPVQLAVEVLVVLTEGAVYYAFQKTDGLYRRPFLQALILNAVSYGIGVLINLLR